MEKRSWLAVPTPVAVDIGPGTKAPTCVYGMWVEGPMYVVPTGGRSPYWRVVGACPSEGPWARALHPKHVACAPHGEP